MSNTRKLLFLWPISTYWWIYSLSLTRMTHWWRMEKYRSIGTPESRQISSSWNSQMTCLCHRFFLWFLSNQDPRWWIWWSRLSRTMRRSASDSQHDVLKDEVLKCPSLRWFSVCCRKVPEKHPSMEFCKHKEQAKQLSVRITDAFGIPDGKQVKCHCRPFNVRPFNGIPGKKRRRTEQHKRC